MKMQTKIHGAVIGGARMLSCWGLRSESSYQHLSLKHMPSATTRQIHKDHLLAATGPNRGRVWLCWLRPQQFENRTGNNDGSGFPHHRPSPRQFEKLHATALNLTANYAISGYYGEAARHIVSRMVLRRLQLHVRSSYSPWK